MSGRLIYSLEWQDQRNQLKFSVEILNKIALKKTQNVPSHYFFQPSLTMTWHLHLRCVLQLRQKLDKIVID